MRDRIEISDNVLIGLGDDRTRGCPSKWVVLCIVASFGFLSEYDKGFLATCNFLEVLLKSQFYKSISIEVLHD